MLSIAESQARDSMIEINRAPFTFLAECGVLQPRCEHDESGVKIERRVPNTVEIRSLGSVAIASCSVESINASSLARC